MELTKSILVALFTLTVVFGVLAMLFLIIRFFSLFISELFKKDVKPVSAQNSGLPVTTDVSKTNSAEFSSGTLIIKNVDEPTAAMIMAIVSDESGIPLSELCFKSIRLNNK